MLEECHPVFRRNDPCAPDTIYFIQQRPEAHFISFPWYVFVIPQRLEAHPIA